MKRDQLISIFFIVLLIFVVFQIFRILSPFMTAIFWSAILAFAFYPLYTRLKERLKTHEIIPAFIMTFLILLIVIPPVIILVVNITNQAIWLYQFAVTYIQEGRLEETIRWIRSFGWIENFEEKLFRWEIVKQWAENWLLTSTRAFGNFTAAQVGTITKNILFVILNLIMMVILVFIFLKDGGKIYRFIYEVAPLEEHTKQSIFRPIHDTLAAVIRGQLLTSLVQSVVAGIVFWQLGLPVPILFAGATFLTALIPFIGASGIWIPLTIYLVLQQAYPQAIILFIVGFLGISMIDNVLKPIIIGERTKLPYFLLFFGILGGLKVYGLMGVFLAPVVLSLFFALVKVYQEKYSVASASD